MFRFFKRRKFKLFSEIINDIENIGLIKNNGQIYYYLDNLRNIKEWEFNTLKVEIGVEVEIIEYYVRDNIHYREKYSYIVV